MQRAINLQGRYLPVLVLLTLIVVLQSLLIDHDGESGDLTRPLVTQRSRFINENGVPEKGPPPSLFSNHSRMIGGLTLPETSPLAIREMANRVKPSKNANKNMKNMGTDPAQAPSPPREALSALVLPRPVSVRHLREDLIELAKAPTLSMVGIKSQKREPEIRPLGCGSITDSTMPALPRS